MGIFSEKEWQRRNPTLWGKTCRTWLSTNSRHRLLWDVLSCCKFEFNSCIFGIMLSPRLSCAAIWCGHGISEWNSGRRCIHLATGKRINSTKPCLLAEQKFIWSKASSCHMYKLISNIFEIKLGFNRFKTDSCTFVRQVGHDYIYMRCMLTICWLEQEVWKWLTRSCCNWGKSFHSQNLVKWDIFLVWKLSIVKVSEW